MSLKKSQFLETLELIGKDPNSFADLFYQNIFKASPGLSQTFRNTDLRLQKAELIKGLIQIFAHIDNDEKLSDFLQELGLRHLCYEVKEQDYPLIERSLKKTVKEFHGNSWNESLEKYWDELLNLITHQMIIGSRQVRSA